MFDLKVKSDPGARMQLVGLGELMHPGTCMVCGAGTRDGGYVRIGVYYEYEGEMYICREFCLPELILTVGGLTTEEAQQFTADANDILLQNEELKAQLEAANERLQHFDALLSDSAAVSIDGSFMGVFESESEGGESASTTPVFSDSGESESEEPVKGPRSTNSARLTVGDGDTIQL